jgi:2-methylisocitrate lyase-like PEP mutase family enzyme
MAVELCWCRSISVAMGRTLNLGVPKSKTRGSPLPVNIMVSQGEPLSALAKRGVARVSYGADPSVVTMNGLLEAARKAKLQ